MKWHKNTEALVVTSVGGDAELTPVILSPIQQTEVLVEIHATGVYNISISCMAGKLLVEFPNVLRHEGIFLFWLIL